MNLLDSVTATLRAYGTPFALIGAAAMATWDLDLLVTDVACLKPAYWDRAKLPDIQIAIRPGDDAVVVDVERELPVLPPAARQLWRRIRG